MEDQSYPSMDVDDLFGDAEQVALPSINVIATPPVKGLAKRLDELSTSGCSSKIAWSKNGCVAYITPDRYAVHIRVFSRDPSTGKWDLGKATPVDIPHGQDDFPFVHVSWSNLGNDLSIINAAGQVMIFSCAMALDRMGYMRSELTHPEADMDFVIGMHWLAIMPHEQQNQIAWSANKIGDTWSFHIEQHHFKHMHHPADQKAALVYLKSRGDLRLRFQQPDSSWQEVGSPLESTLSTREAFTHAAFASNGDNTLLLAAYAVSGRLHLYRVETSWNVPPLKPGQPHPKQYDKPQIVISLLNIEDNCYPTMMSSDMNGGGESRVRLPAQLTHLDFLPATPEKNDGSVPTIQMVFSTPPNVVPMDQTQQAQTPFSVVVRWEVHQLQRNMLHSSLDKVSSKKKSVNSVPARNIWTLKRQEDGMMHSVVLSFTPIWYSMVLGFVYSDGTIEFRKRGTMAIISPDYSTEAVTSMSQSGFSFPPHEASLYTALSPNQCVAACMQTDGKITLRSMDYTHGSLSAAEDPDHRISAALAALALQTSTAANQYITSDDIFSIIENLPASRKDEFTKLMFQSLSVSIDCGIDDQSSNHLILLGRSPFFVKTLSAIHVLGLHGKVSRSLSSLTAWVILNIKYVTQIITTIARMHGQIDKQPLRPEVVPQFVGLCQWSMHFMTYIIDDLLELSRGLTKPGAPPLTKDLLEATLHQSKRPALLFLLSGFPRTMLKLWTQPLAWVMRSAATYSNASAPPEMRKLYTPLHAVLHEAPADFRQFDYLIREVEHLVRGCYRRDPSASKEGKEGEAARNQAERELLAGRIPEVLWPAARKLVSESLWGPAQGRGEAAEAMYFADKVDVARITFFDTTWLGFTDSRRAQSYFDTHVVDVCQKMVIRGPSAQPHHGALSRSAKRNRSDSIQSAGGAGNVDDKRKERKLRQCVRCSACMEDVLMGLPGYAATHVSWLMGVAKHCICGNSWMLVNEKDLLK
ncbi:hypothetical protein DM02DRAFT_731213 [Periconia macrospinosa]|uniref:Mediator of RNA polymerase II transcription subunit 16 n=1 Tax=Periconia macrospinosa TaxID=97972 RepID=A0A2V1DE90_9PLEO|nr:hypothetical protein DM02DRAFT_731213 [Periconia macrospinosa]